MLHFFAFDYTELSYDVDVETFECMQGAGILWSFMWWKKH